jgi:hypothetical protein
MIDVKILAAISTSKSKDRHARDAYPNIFDRIMHQEGPGIFAHAATTLTFAPGAV